MVLGSGGSTTCIIGLVLVHLICEGSEQFILYQPLCSYTVGGLGCEGNEVNVNIFEVTGV